MRKKSIVITSLGSVDLALLGGCRADVQETTRALAIEALKVGLTMNHDKTEYLHMRRYNTSRSEPTNLNGGDIVFKG